MVSEGQISVPGPVGTGYGEQPHSTGTMPSLPRAKSDVALYTPMRRRSLLITPGTATRATTPINPIPPKPRTRHSLPCTPARRGSPEPIDMISFPLPFSTEDPASIPRALTPCESDYKQTGAFKLGTLRITNGSPTRSPAVDSRDEDSNRQTKPLLAGPTNPENSLPFIEIHPAKSYMSPQSPSLNDPRSPLSPQSPQLQVTSKHTAMEDELFEDDQREFSTVEVLDVRVDLNAKSLPPRPSLVSVGSNISPGLSRADSGIVTSPVSETPHKSLVKADSGYSSNVSLRSFSSKRRVRENDSRSGGELENQPGTPGCSPKTEEPVSTNMAVSDLQDEAWPPSTSEKDHRPSLEEANGISLSRRNLRLLGSFTKKSKASMSEFCTRSEDKVDAQAPAATPSSTLSIDITARKQNKIQSFLSGARRRKSFSTVQTTHTHPSEQTGIPPVPQDVQTKLHRRSGSLPKLMRTDMLKSERSRDTLGTILSVGSAELSLDETAPVPQFKIENIEPASTRETHEQSQDSTTTLRKSGTSTVHDTKSFASRHLIARKPLPSYTKSKDGREHVKPSPSRSLSQDSIHHHSGNRPAQGRSLSTTEYENRVRPPAPGRINPTTSLRTTNIESGPNVMKDAKRASVDKPRFATPAELPPTTKSPPPVSMRNRSKGYIPSRPKSTPPGTSDVRSGSQLPRKESHDRLYGNLSSVIISHSTSTSVSRNPSYEKLQHCSSMQSQSYVYHNPSSMLSIHPKINLRQPPVLRPRTGEDRAPKWNVQNGGHDLSRSRMSSFDRDGPYSITLSTQTSSNSSRANSFQDHPGQVNPQLVRHRSSYDGHTGLHLRSRSRENNPCLSSMPQTRGHAYASGPPLGHSVSQQRHEPPRNIPHVSRSHARNRSSGSCDAYGNPLPFRVLHSYNSPAYRNAPIWG